MDACATGGHEIEVTVLLPCLDEAETIAVCVRKALACLRDLGIHGEVLVSDNGSTDGSPEIAEAMGARVVHAPIRGYGGALMAGIDAARGRYVIMADADDSYDVSNLGPFVAELRAGHDVVMGNRFRGGIAPGAMPPLHQYLGNPVLSWVGRRLFKLPAVGDCHCGIRGFNTARIRALRLCLPGMEFASEMVVRAALAHYDIVEVPATLSPDGRSKHAPHLRTWRDGWRHLRFMLIFAPRRTLTMPGYAFAALGLLTTILLATGPKTVGSVTFDVNSLAYACLALLVGVQTILVGAFASLYGRHERLVAGPVRGVARWLRLEVCIAAGLCCIALGLAGTLMALGRWGEQSFGNLTPNTVIRLVLPSATMIAIGVVVIFAGFFASLLTLRGVQATAVPAPSARDLNEVARIAR